MTAPGEWTRYSNPNRWLLACATCDAELTVYARSHFTAETEASSFGWRSPARNITICPDCAMPTAATWADWMSHVKARQAAAANPRCAHLHEQGVLCASCLTYLPVKETTP